MIDAINHGLREEMARNPKIVMWGEDVADPKGGVFGVTRGLTTSFPGPREIHHWPKRASLESRAVWRSAVTSQLSKSSLAITSGRPLCRCGTRSLPSAGVARAPGVVPVVVRVAVGGYIKGGPWHSACIEAFFAHIPGWYVVFPSCAEDAKGLIKMAARAEDPVLFLEHKGLYRRPQAKSQEPDAEYCRAFRPWPQFAKKGGTSP